MGRCPTNYNHAIASDLCERIVNGESLRSICKDAHMPSASTVFKWVSSFNTDKDAAPFKAMYDRACVERSEALVEDIIFIADEAEMTKEGVLKARLQTEVRKWHAGVARPTKYGKLAGLVPEGEKLGHVERVVFEMATQDDKKTENIEAESVEAVSEATD